MFLCSSQETRDSKKLIPFIRAEGFNAPPLEAFLKVLNPECNSTGERTIPRCLRRGSFIFLLIVFFTPVNGVYAQTEFPAGDYWSLDAGLGMGDILVEGLSFQTILEPKLWLSPPLMVGSKIGMNYSNEENSHDIFTFEGQVYLRWNFLRLGSEDKKTNIFIQGGLGLIAAYRGNENPFNDVTLTRGSVLADVAVGITIPLSARWHIEPSFRSGYPHLWGTAITAGYKFPLPQKTVYSVKTEYKTEFQTRYVEVIKTLPPTEIIKRIVINAVEYIIFAGDIYTYNAVIDDDAQALNDMTINHVAQVLGDNPDFQVRIEGHANPVTRHPREIDELLDLSTYRAYEVARVLREKGVSNKQLIISAYGGTRTVTRYEDVDHWNMNRRVEMLIIQIDTN